MTGALATLVVAASITGLPATAHAASAAGGTTATGTPHEVATLPAPVAAAHRKDILVTAGTTGFLHQEQGLPGYTWTDYATGNDTHVPHLDGASFMTRPYRYPASAGGDALFYWTFNQTPAQLNVGTPATGAWNTYPLPSGTLGVAGMNGTRALLHGPGGVVRLVQLNSDGTTTDLPISGLPSGYSFAVPTLDASSGTVAMIAGSPPAGTTGPAHNYLVQLDTGAAVQLPDTLRGGFLSGGYVSSISHYEAPTTVVSLKVSDAFASTPVQPTTTSFTLPGSTQVWGVVGGHLVVTDELSGYDPTTLYATPVGSTAAPTQIDSGLVTNAPDLVFGPSGALAVGGSSNSVTVQRLSGAADGSLAVTSVRQLPPPTSTTATLTMAYGQVRQMLSVPQVNATEGFPVFTTPLITPAPSQGEGLGRGPAGVSMPLATPGPCAADADCVRMVDGNRLGPSYISPDGRAYAGSISGNSFGAGATVVDSDDNFGIVDQGGRQYLWEAGMGAVSSQSVAATGAALWQHTLWRSSATTPGQIQSYALQPGLTATPVVRTVSTGTACAPSEIQVAQRWLYWSCGSSGPAGVHDLTTNAEIPLPAGPVLLGDGFVVAHDTASGELRMTDLHNDAVGATTTLATFPATGATADDRHLTWTVDRTSGEVAYAGTDNVVHVLTTGVPDSPVTALSAESGDTVFVGQYSLNVYGSLSRPIASWRMVISRADNGRQVRVLTGGQTAAEFSTYWDGLTDAGTKPLDGRYTWQLWATPLDDPTAPAAPVAGASGSVDVRLGRQTFHSYNDDGRPNLFGIAATSTSQNAAGDSVVYEGEDKGFAMVLTGPDVPANLDAAYSKVATLIPFGDLNGDGQNDLLVRLSNGTLGYYRGLPNCSDAATCRPISLGGGWNIYDRLVSVGDLNGDGHDDLVARDRSGVLWLYAGTGHGGFAHRVRLGAGWKAYTQIVGVGDLNGDGAGDLLAVDAKGRMWRYLGNGHGSFGARTYLGSGWSSFNALVGVGDLNGDGHNDLVARDRSGVLWFYAGDGRGGFAPRVRVGGGWNRFSTIY